VANSAQDHRYRELINQLREARLSAKISQADLAAQLRVRQQFISKYENGERRLDAVEFIDIARCLGLDPITILGDV
jgi:transcriptional regulator with XRE-family HTH domain